LALFIEVGFGYAKLSADLSMQFEPEPSFFFRPSVVRGHAHERGVLHKLWHEKTALAE